MNKIHIITICKNEVDIIQKFIDHHIYIADRFSIIDNGSTDGTLDILTSNNNNKKIELIYDESPFKLKIEIIKKVISASICDIIVPLDVDEFMIHEYRSKFSKHPSLIKKYLQNLSLGYSTYQIKNIYNYIPNSTDKYSKEKNYWRAKKFLIKKNDFIDSCPGFHNIISKTKYVCPIDISYIHMHYRSFDAWYKSARQKMMARLGKDWNNIQILKDYQGYSNHVAKELYSYFTTGKWFLDLQEDIEIKI